MRSNQAECRRRAMRANAITFERKNVLSAERSSTEIDFLSQSLLVLDPTTSCAVHSSLKSTNLLVLVSKIIL